MIRIVEKWRLIAATVGILKVLLTVIFPIYSDVVNWAAGASLVLGFISTGRFPPIAATGIYWGMELVLAPFLWLWTKLPIEHPPITWANILYANPTSPPAFFLKIMMSVPTFLADIVTGVLVSKLTKQLTGSDIKSKVAFLAWYLNPFNILVIYLYGSMDVIPTSIFLLALILAGKEKWFRSGLCVCIAAILRIFPFLTFPFFLPAIRTQKNRSLVYLLSGFLIPLISGLGLMYATGAGTFTAIANIPARQYWLLDFLGMYVTSQYVRLSIVLVAAQLFIANRYWRSPSILHLATVSILAIFVGALPYGGDANHFLWVSPLLTVCLMLRPEQLWIFILTFAATIALSLYTVAPFDTFLWGAQYATRAMYLVKINLDNINIEPGIYSLRTP